jgi:hypothetical protein
MEHRWGNLAFLHWRYRPDVVQDLLPDGLTVETFDGSAWVGLVPFEMTVTAPRRGPVPWLSRFAETNVRTYATAADGTTGVWFLSLDAARLAAVVTARTTYALPYFWSAMSVESDPLRVHYQTSRRWPGPSRPHSDVTVDIGDRYRPDQLDDLDHWLTARYRLFTHRPTGLRGARAQHAPWVLHRAGVAHLDDELITATGLPRPVGPPLVHWSPGVDVDVGTPYRVVQRAITPFG